MSDLPDLSYLSDLSDLCDMCESFSTIYCRVLCTVVLQVTSGTVEVGSTVVCKVDYDRRANVAPNHTMTHVLNFALRKARTCYMLVYVLYANLYLNTYQVCRTQC